MNIQSVGLFGKYKDASVRDSIERLRSHLTARGVNVFIGETTSNTVSGPRVSDNDADLDEIIDLAIVVGGDGTMLHVARELSQQTLPVIGINLGRLGFLTDIPADTMLEDIDQVLDGKHYLEERMMLSVEIQAGEKIVYQGTGLNDIVISKGEVARLIETITFVDDEFVTRTRGDGLVIATPTGSTAYSLSAGGPILHPTLAAIVIVPICPHTLSNRPLVLSENSLICIEAVEFVESAAHVAVDGFIRYSLKGSEKIYIRRSDQTVHLLRTSNHNHYEGLRSKLGWGTINSQPLNNSDTDPA